MNAEVGAGNAEVGNGANDMRQRKTYSSGQDMLFDRTTDFALRVIKMVEALPRSRNADVIGKQVLRSATSVGANYRAARRARSPAEFCAKLGIVEEESDECAYWFELLIKSGLLPEAKLSALVKETDEITAMVVSSIRTARHKIISTKGRS